MQTRHKKSEGNAFNPIFKESVQGRKRPGSCVFVEPELNNYRKPKHAVQNKTNGHKITNDSHNSHDKNHDVIELYHGNSKRNTSWHSTQDQRTPKTVLYAVMGCCWPMHKVTWYLYPYYGIENPELYNRNIHLEPGAYVTNAKRLLTKSF